MNKAKSILLTGYSGFLGRHTLHALSGADWRIHLAGRKTVGSPKTFRYSPIDLRRPESLSVLRECEPFDAVVHLACHVGLDGASEAEMLAANVISTGLLADLSRGWDAQFVFASSALIHGVGTQRIGANSEILADLPYTRSKLLGERIIQAASDNHCILRMGGLFGLSGPGHLGLNGSISAALTGQSPRLSGDGKGRRNYLYVADAARAVVSAVERQTVGTHLLAGSEAPSIREMVEAVCSTFLPSARPSEIEGRESRDQIIDSSSAFAPGRSFQAALDDIAAEARACALA